MEAAIQRVAAVVSPRIFSLVLSMVPAPRKPIPTTTEAAILEGSDPGKASIDKIARRDDPSPTRRWVLKPAGFRLTQLAKTRTRLFYPYS